MLATCFVYIPSIQESPPYSRQRRYKAKKGKGQKKTSLYFFFCRCCYSCKQKSRHPIIPVGEKERQDGPSPANQPPPLPSPPKKKKQNWQGYHLSKAWIVVRAHHYSLQVLTVLHTRRCSVFPKLYPLPKLFSFCLSLSASLFLSFCPALPPPIRNSASQDPLRACVSCLSVLSV